MPTLSPLSSAALSTDVLMFAAQQGVSSYLDRVLEMTSRVFPNQPITVAVDEDPEIANDRHIVFDVAVSGWSAEQMFDCQRRWNSEIFQQCPAAQVCVFRLTLTDEP